MGYAATLARCSVNGQPLKEWLEQEEVQFERRVEAKVEPADDEPKALPTVRVHKTMESRWQHRRILREMRQSHEGYLGGPRLPGDRHW